MREALASSQEKRWNSQCVRPHLRVPMKRDERPMEMIGLVHRPSRRCVNSLRPQQAAALCKPVLYMQHPLDQAASSTLTIAWCCPLASSSINIQQRQIERHTSQIHPPPTPATLPQHKSTNVNSTQVMKKMYYVPYSNNRHSTGRETVRLRMANWKNQFTCFDKLAILAKNVKND